MSTRQPGQSSSMNARKSARANEREHLSAKKSAQQAAVPQASQVRTSAKRVRAAAAEEEQECESAASKRANITTTDAPLTARQQAARNLAARKLEEVRRVADTFEKNHPQLRFGNSPAAFVAFSLRFRAYLVHQKLEQVITELPDPALTGFAAKLEAERQRAVYYMLTVAAPSELQQALYSTLQDKTGYHAWKLLRERFLGPEHVYRQKLAQDFQNITWQAGELFGDFEARFTALVSELEQANGQEASSLDKQATVLRAIRQREGPLSPTYTRLYQMNLMLVNRGGAQAEQEVPFAEWIANMREEARRIEADRASQQQHQQQHQQHQQRAAGAASATSSVQLPMRLNAMAHGQTERPVCRNWVNFGSCVYGNSCRYEHVGQSQQQPQPMFSRPQSLMQRQGGARRFAGPPMAARTGPAAGQQRDNVCFQWKAAGQCQRGAACRFAHSNQQQNAGSMQRSSPTAQPQYQANVLYHAAEEQLCASPASS